MQPESSKTAHLELPPIAVLETAPVLATPAPASQRKRLAPEGYKLLTGMDAASNLTMRQ